jgi:hypothetical protein
VDPDGVLRVDGGELVLYIFMVKVDSDDIFFPGRQIRGNMPGLLCR